MKLVVAVLLVAFVALDVCVGSMILTSPEFVPDSFIPGVYGCDILNGVDRDMDKPSPPLQWFRPPTSTQSFILLVDDVDNNEAVHWLVTDIPKDAYKLEPAASGLSMPVGSRELPNAFGFDGYAGPCPSNETHTIRFRLFAMPKPTTLLELPHRTNVSSNQTLVASDITKQIDEENLYCAVYVGKYFSPIACAVSVGPNDPCPCPGPECPLKHAYPCPVFVPIGKECPCPGPDCPLNSANSNITKIRYVKPSEARKAHPIMPPNDIPAEVSPVDCDEVTAHAREYAQTENVAFDKPPPVPQSLSPVSSKAAAIVEDVPMPLQEQRKRHLREGGVPKVEGLMALQMQETGSGDGVDAVEARHLAADEASLLSEFGDNLAAVQHQGSEEMEWGNVFGLEDLHQEGASAGGDMKVVSQEPTVATTTECTINAKHGCRRRKVIAPRFGLTVWSKDISTINDTSILSSEFQCSHSNISELRESFPVSWSHIPRGTQSLVLMLDDATSRVYSNPENPTEIIGGSERVLWLVSNIPTQYNTLPKGASGTPELLPPGAVELVKFKPPCQDNGDGNVIDLPRVFRLSLFAMAVDSSYVRLPDRGATTAPFVTVQLHPLYTAVEQVKLA
eukprot:c9379_g1_i1.p1 GENE.c9379_g1_i1~~c9379_g1_i1.p1  ORF type:complete len:642 (+),score=197.72 c9379_g1_i1:71-1927(+)